MLYAIQMIFNYFADEKYESIRWLNYETLCSKELKRRSSVCVFDQDKNPQTGLRQWQHILHELETYIIDVWGISYGTLGACHMWKIIFEGGEELSMTPWGERPMWGRHLWRRVQTLENTMRTKWNVVQNLPYNLNFKQTAALTAL